MLKYNAEGIAPIPVKPKPVIPKFKLAFPGSNQYPTLIDPYYISIYVLSPYNLKTGMLFYPVVFKHRPGYKITKSSSNPYIAAPVPVMIYTAQPC